MAALAQLMAVPVSAHSYYAPIDASRWHVESTRFECRMTHELPYYGTAVFEQRAGEDAAFYLRNIRAQLRDGTAGLRVTGAEWQPQRPQQDLGKVAIKTGDEPVSLDGTQSRYLLLSLHEGGMPRFYSLAEKDLALQVSLSPVNFQPAYRQYNQCLEQLLPVNFVQASNTSIYFSATADLAVLPAEERRRLDAVAIYLQNDTAIQSVLVDGYNDNSERGAESMAVSEKRAKQVMAYLVQAGVKAEQIVTRWHGERYPVASNKTTKGKAQNRRVTVRLSKDTPSIIVENEKKLAANPVLAINAPADKKSTHNGADNNATENSAADNNIAADSSEKKASVAETEPTSN
jgi:outer membrane protein OmpA-like peptidoglycan-associated protein